VPPTGAMDLMIAAHPRAPTTAYQSKDHSECSSISSHGSMDHSECPSSRPLGAADHSKCSKERTRCAPDHCEWFGRSRGEISWS